MRVEVENDALRRLRRRDDPVAVLVGRVLQGVTRGGDVARLAGVEDAAALRCCDGDREGGRRRREVIEWKLDKNRVKIQFLMHFATRVAVEPYKSTVNGAFLRTVTQRVLLHLPCFSCMKM